MQTIASAMIAVINPLPSGSERIQFYRVVVVVVDKYNLWNSEWDPVAYKRY